MRCSSVVRGRCIWRSELCDGVNDCGDNSDESRYNCWPEGSEDAPCDGFLCIDGTGDCILGSWVCDGDNDCGDYSDEQYCDTDMPCHGFLCTDGYCIPGSWECDGRNDCDDDSDEQYCGTDPPCDGFLCSDGDCIPGSLVCDGNNDCGDYSDEQSNSCRCPTCRPWPPCYGFDFLCPDGFCILGSLVCDGVNNCGDYADEQSCHTAAGVPCDGFLCPDEYCIPGSLLCDGNNDCGDNSDEQSCPIGTPCGTVLCPNGYCLPGILVCNGYDDCGDNSDEQSCYGICDSRMALEHDEYVFTVPTFNLTAKSKIPHVIITTPSRDPVNVTLSIPGLNLEICHTTDRNHHADIPLPIDIHLNHGDGKQNVTGIIRSSGMVAVHVIDNEFVGGDVFTVYSSSRLGNVYYVATYTPDTSFFCVTALSPDTVVSVKKKFQQNNIYHLRQYESYRFDGSGGEDLSGTRIESNKPVAVIAGGNVAIRAGIGFGNGALEQLPPVSSWGHTYVVAPFFNSYPYVFRVYAGTMLTTLHISNDYRVTIPPEDFYEGIGDKILTLLSDQPVMVLQYLTGNFFQNFESMIIMPPVTAYTSNVTFFVFRYKDITIYYHPARYYINVVMECTYIDGLLLDNQATVWDDQLSSDDKEMCCVRKKIHTGEHYVEHANPNAQFFVYVYGICSGPCASSYVYPASDVYFRRDTNGRTTLPTSTGDTNERTTLPTSTGICDSGMALEHDEYVFTVPTFYSTWEWEPPHVFITTPSRDPVNVTLSIPGLNLEICHTTDRNHHADIPLPIDIRLNHGNGKQNVTGIIRSSGMVAVHVIDTKSIGGDVFTVYSSSRLGNVYYVATYTPDTSFFCVTALSPDTVVSVTKQFQQNNIYHLRQYESYRFDGNGAEDLSGTRIESNKPVVVIAGGIVATGNQNIGFGDGALEQLPPVSSWGHTYVLAPFFYSDLYVFRVYAGTMFTTLHISNNDTVTILPEDFYEGTGDKVLTLISDQPVMVSQYLPGKGIQSFESMIIIPPVTSYTSNVTFFVLMYGGITFGSVEYHPTHYHINVIMECTYIDGLLLDNQATVWDDQLSSDNKEMCCVRKDIFPGEHYVEHANPNANFFVYVYGICSHPMCASSYVYPASDVYFRKDTNGRTTLTTSTDGQADDPCQQVNIISRNDWGAEPPTAAVKNLTGAVSDFIHHTGGPPCSNQSECSSRVRGIQNHHMNIKGWKDIGYSF
ncbi:uncharacterized protein [Amphiura filiformis]|uniref:uncharacterized protein n=1 Tax=Amphiura filiformis TaxID=82378 RepID=UPI003B21761E